MKSQREFCHHALIALFGNTLCFLPDEKFSS